VGVHIGHDSNTALIYDGQIVADVAEVLKRNMLCQAEKGL
jgi:predicted NodU family carbamoyl transferase